MKKKAFYNSGWLFCIISIALFGIMLFFNTMTPYVADDYVYMFSFSDGKPLAEGGFLEIFRSMYAHSFCMNGRAVSHGFEQLFMLFPKSVFNVVNSFVMVFTIYVMYRIINYRERKNCILYLAVAMAVWHYTPAFGQVYLWQVGSVNYLWSVFGMVLFLSPYIFRFVHNKDILRRGWQKAVFCLLSVVMGFYHEIPSFIVIVISAILLVLIAVMKNGKKFNWLTVATICAVIGYIMLLMMPVEMGAKQAKLELSVLISNFLEVTKLLRETMLTIMIIWAVFFTMGCMTKINGERLILSGIFAGGAVAAAYMMTIASYIPDRCMITSTVLAILAVGILVPGLSKTSCKALPVCYGVILTIVFAFSFIEGSIDILNSKFQVSEREQVIEQSKAEGVTDLELKLVKPSTKYSPFYALIDLQTVTHNTWPNTHMSHYYGVNSILGVE